MIEASLEVRGLWTTAPLFFTEVKKHEPDLRRPSSSAPKKLVKSAKTPAHRLELTRQGIGQASCYTISLFEQSGGRVGSALINQRFTRIYALNEQSLAIEMKNWSGQSTLDARDFLNASKLDQHLPHDLVKGWSSTNNLVEMDTAALSTLLGTAALCFNAVAKHSVLQPFTRPVYTSPTMYQLKIGHNAAFDMSQLSGRRTLAGAARPSTIGKSMWTGKVERKENDMLPEVSADKRRRDSEDPEDPQDDGEAGGSKPKRAKQGKQSAGTILHGDLTNWSAASERAGNKTLDTTLNTSSRQQSQSGTKATLRK
jgi:hypothetical protein